MSEKERIAAAKAAQDHDSDPPRCANCCYFRREPHTKYIERAVLSRKGKPQVIKIRLRKHPVNNPIIDRCSFGNFEVKPHHVCDAWHGRDGSKIENRSDDECAA